MSTHSTDSTHRAHTSFNRLAAGPITACLAALTLLAACSSSRSSTSASTTATIPGSASSTPASTTPTSTAPTSTAVPAASTTAAPAVDMTLLRADGVGGLNFGHRANDVMTALTATFGAPDTDESASYPTPNGPGTYLDSFGDTQFGAPYGRTVCYLNGLCAYFGGSDPANLSFVGWSYYDSPAASGLHTPTGVTMGARWADFPEIMIHTGGCYTQGTGLIDSIDLGLQSSGVPFTEIDGAGNWVNNVPDAADVTVTAMSAGEMPIFLAGDC